MKVQRREATDVLTRDGETAILIRGKVLRLSEVSAAIYTLTENLVELDYLAHELESRFGAPADRSPHEATKDAVADMIRHGILSRRD